ncbi:MAG TPA: SRPBCC family protein [Verrucomicrobiae bacterium]|nr:SRPBCC family protein [Verrucomicrobiae bacterium]
MGKTKFTIEPGQSTITIEREFDAPREKVFAAFIDPDVIGKWWGGKTYETTIETFEPHAGGSWRFVQKTSDAEYAFHGVFHDVTAPERAIQTFEFDGLPESGHVAMDSMWLTEENGKTKMKIVSAFQSVEDRDGMVDSGMEKGASEGYDVLAEIVESA